MGRFINYTIPDYWGHWGVGGTIYCAGCNGVKEGESPDNIHPKDWKKSEIVSGESVEDSRKVKLNLVCGHTITIDKGHWIKWKP